MGGGLAVLLIFGAFFVGFCLCGIFTKGMVEDLERELAHLKSIKRENK